MKIDLNEGIQEINNNLGSSYMRYYMCFILRIHITYYISGMYVHTCYKFFKLVLLSRIIYYNILIVNTITQSSKGDVCVPMH